MIPDNITKEHLEKAIEEIDRDGVRKGRHSSTYDLIHNGKSYPPKLIISIANRFANGLELDSNNFNGGKETAAFELLEKKGYKIIEKGDDHHYKIIKEYINDLKSSKTKAADSIIKLITQDRFEDNLQKIDKYFFESKLKIINFSNYQNLISFLKDKHKIKSGVYNDFNIWSASKTYLQKANPSLISRHEELNRVLGFPDNGNGLYKSFLGQNNLIKFIINKFSTDRKLIYDSLRKKMEDAGFQFEKEQVPQRQKRKEKELKFVHPVLIAKLNENNLKVNARKFYLKPLSDEPDCEIGLVTGKTSPLLTEDLFIKPNSIDTYNDNPAWSNNDIDFTLDKFLLSIKSFLNKSENNMKLTLNTILYGPPGTGKTYRLKNEFFDRFTDKGSNQSKEEYLEKLVTDYSWWEVIAASLYDLKAAKVKNISEHPILKAKVAVSSNKNVRATLWGTLQAHTIQECEHVNYTNRQAPLIFNKNGNSEWEVIEENLTAEAPEIIELVSNSKNFKPVTTKKKRYVFTTFHQSFSYEDFIEGIKPIVYEDEQNPEKGKQVIYDIKPGLFKKIVKEANEDRENDYAIFIDEINRGNIANIFGELITLIEDDKRIDTDNYIPAKLPYSNQDFGVPPNLYIIGTMNTADRSVEALDTALRRRFSFIEMNPEPSKLSLDEFKCDDINLEKLLIAINGRIEKLLDKDYCIGHSYFMTIKNRQQPLDELKVIFQNKILPLLQEYFYGDWGKIMLVIGEKFVENKKDSIKFLSTNSYEDFEEYDEKPIYNFTKPSSWTLDSFKTIYE